MKKITALLLAIISLLVSFQTIQAQTALSFVGTTSVLTNNAPVLNNGARTVDAWIKTSSTITTQQVICDWGTMAVNGGRFTLNTINGKLRIEVGGVGIIGTTSVNTGQWCHVTAVYQPSITTGPNVFLYINGNLELQGNFTGYPTLVTANTNGLRLGVRNDGINLFNGLIDEVKVYNYGRTQSQIAADTLEYCGPVPGLVAYYKLNEGVPNAANTGSNIAIDYSGNGNNGTLFGFALTGNTSNWVPGRVGLAAASLSVSPAPFICSGNSATLSTSSTNYTWSTGNTTNTSIVVSPASTTVYSVTATNSLNCVSASVVTITVNNQLPSVSVSSPQNPVCPGMPTAFTASGASTYSWSGGISNAQTFSPTTTSAYTLVAGNGCGTVSSVHTMSVNQLPINVLASPTTVCEGYTCQLTSVSAATNFTWLPGNFNTASPIVSPTATTIYTLAAENSTCSGTQTLLVNTLTTPVITLNSTLVTVCAGSSVVLTASGAGTNGSYAWTPGGSTAATATLSSPVNTLVTVAGTNSLGCTSTAQVPLIVQSQPTVGVSSNSVLACAGQSVTLFAYSANSYTWSNGANTPSIIVLPPANGTVYTVSATANNNTCIATRTINVAVYSPNITYSSTLTLCEGSTGTLTASGATSYSWNAVSVGASGSQTIMPTSSSIYTLTTLSNSASASCYSTFYSSVTVNQNPTVTASNNTSLTVCRGVSCTLTALGATNYVWSTAGTSSSIVVTPSLSTTYTVTGTDQNQCSSTATVLVKIASCQGIAQNKDATGFSMYPNPASGELTIVVEQITTCSLYDALGNEVLRLNLKEASANTIEISHLPKGIYFLQAHSADKQLRQKLIIE